MEETFVIQTPEGKEVECTIIDTFYSEEFGKGYVIYVDGSINENGQENVFASSYDLEYPETLMEIESDEEWQMIEQALKELEEQEKVEAK